MITIKIVTSITCKSCLGYIDLVKSYYKDREDVEVVGVDASTGEGTSLIKEYGLRGLPSVLIFKDDNFEVLSGNWPPSSYNI